MIARATDLVIRGKSARFLGQRFPCRTGSGGVTSAKREGDGATPTGAHCAELVFYRPDRIRPPPTCLPVRPLRRFDGWSDDPEYPKYNFLIRRPCDSRHERLWLPSCVYDVIVVLGWNRHPPVRGLGSAIFLHVLDPLGRPTAGCVSLQRRHLRFVLAHWGPDSRLVVG